ncbi:MAG: serine/threonine protein kinase [Nostocales cyanobacterium]|nr:MAG: serine/threonine protein kinase [Nostocales cyanobacterium]TAF16904.1 MAG: serine/threonine protein kinase [Nostocales cyanobacterium]
MTEKNLKHGDKRSNCHQDYPNLSGFGYEVIQELGHNYEGGRITYLAQQINCQQKVVIKEFCCAKITTDWHGNKPYEREIQLLQKLNHPRIPCYLNSFEKTGFFYLVQEYKKAPSLGFRRCFHPEEIKKIAISILEILDYLQQQKSPIIHRDIKPENILVDQELNAYLVDFGLAQVQTEKSDLSTLVVGTPGFIPPEEQFGHPLTSASDLYSLGATLICLLNNIPAREISQLIDDQYRFNFHKILPHISPTFRYWLKKMVAPNHKQRYANAGDALAALTPIKVMGSKKRLDHVLSIVDHKKNLAILILIILGISLGWGASSFVSLPGNAINSNVQVKQNNEHSIPTVYIKK